MGEKTIRIGFYGKGGIGKSTIAANVSAVLAQMGKRVLHIGCDPKADSTRYLTEKRIPTVLQQMEALGEEGTRTDIVFPGRFQGISCVEAGGPQAGCGCAGMGITVMEEELDRLGVLDEDWDVILYDVLGDVVCGGFSVPMRRHFVDAVFIVSSSDFMSVYAANNILKAVWHYSGNRENLLGGFVWNHCRTQLDLQAADSFSKMTHTRILCRIKESEEVRRNDYQGTLLTRENPKSGAAMQIQRLAELILNDFEVGAERERMIPHPCSEEELETWRKKLLKEYRK